MSNEDTTTSITIVSIDTKPVHDPYVNIDGILSRTYLKLDPRDRTVWVTQEYQDNSTPMDEWHGLVRTWRVNSHPSEADMRAWIESSMAQLEAICDGFESHWDGNNHRGHYDEAARAAMDAIEFELDNDGGPVNHYEAWSVEEWMDPQLGEITAQTTDDELKAMAEAAEPDSSTIVTGDILDYITQHRDNLIAESDDE